MRVGLAVAVGVVLAFAVPGVAQASATTDCPCVTAWMQAYTGIPWVHQKAQSQLKKRGVPAKKRRQINYALEQYAGRPDWNTGFCRRHRKVCAAAAACAAGAGNSLLHEPAHHTWHGMWSRAAVACAALASPVILA